MVPLKGRSGVRSRGLLRNGSLPIRGAVREVGYFYATLGLGTPKRDFALIIDTGSTITYVPCSTCKQCGLHQDPAYDPHKSSTANPLSCFSMKCDCGSPACQCQNNQCFYRRTYAEQSSSEGFLVEDDFAFPDKAGPVKVVFGCESRESGEIYLQEADGILGMGNNDNAFQSQLVKQGAIEDTFGLCYGFPDGGTMVLGDMRVQGQDSMVHTPLRSGWQPHYYTVVLEGITVAGKLLDVPKSKFATGYGTVMDSGTTFTYLPTEAFKAFSKAIAKAVEAKGLKKTPGADPQFDDICWKGAPKSWDDLDRVFPEVDFVFEPGVRVHMTPYRYLFWLSTGSYCLGVFDNGYGGTLIGGISMRNVLVQYDRRHHQVGFLEVADCNKLERAPSPPARAPPSPPKAEPSPAPQPANVTQGGAATPPPQQQQKQPPPKQQQQQTGRPPGQGSPAPVQGSSSSSSSSKPTGAGKQQQQQQRPQAEQQLGVGPPAGGGAKPPAAGPGAEKQGSPTLQPLSSAPSSGGGSSSSSSSSADTSWAATLGRVALVAMLLVGGVALVHRRTGLLARVLRGRAGAGGYTTVSSAADDGAGGHGPQPGAPPASRASGPPPTRGSLEITGSGGGKLGVPGGVVMV